MSQKLKQWGRRRERGLFHSFILWCGGNELILHLLDFLWLDRNISGTVEAMSIFPIYIAKCFYNDALIYLSIVDLSFLEWVRAFFPYFTCLE
jgi:hypothetical protein